MADIQIEKLRKELRRRAKERSLNGIAVECGVAQPILHRFMTEEQDGLSAESAVRLARFLGVRLGK